MNMNNTPPYNNYQVSPTGEGKSKKKLVIFITLLGLLLVVAGAGAYLAVASAQGWWPFTVDSPAETTKTVEPPIKIKKVTVSTKDGKQMLDIALKLNSKDKGHCVLDLSSKIARLTIDDSKANKQPEGSKPVKPCFGWNVDASALPNGTYTINVKFVGAKSTLTTSDKVTLKDGKTLTEDSDTDHE
ncbi:hypothetical protein RAAC3_TM7C00001G0003 [Candidatus Saccharibacteria bacterium RAAC3_TM7_1]|nr:hypothetical protein RAAC3_TM7C00001G0003 [Candidatus Saccharibacteria bacterium RAAC3_TM7_1]